MAANFRFIHSQHGGDMLVVDAIFRKDKRVNNKHFTRLLTSDIPTPLLFCLQ